MQSSVIDPAAPPTQASLDNAAALAKAASLDKSASSEGFNPLLKAEFAKMIEDMAKKMRKEKDEMEAHKNKIEQINKLNERINQLLDDQSALDISNADDVQALIEEAIENGAPLRSDLKKYNPQQVQHLKQTFDSIRETAQMNINFNKDAFERLLHLLDEFCRTANQVLKESNETKKNITHNMR